MKQPPLPQVKHLSAIPLTEEGEIRAFAQKLVSTKIGTNLVAMEDYFAFISTMLGSAYGRKGFWIRKIHDFEIHRRGYNGEWATLCLQLRELKKERSRIFSARFVTEIIRKDDNKLLVSADFTCIILLKR